MSEQERIDRIVKAKAPTKIYVSLMDGVLTPFVMESEIVEQVLAAINAATPTDTRGVEQQRMNQEAIDGTYGKYMRGGWK